MGSAAVQPAVGVIDRSPLLAAGLVHALVALGVSARALSVPESLKGGPNLPPAVLLDAEHPEVDTLAKVLSRHAGVEVILLVDHPAHGRSDGRPRQFSRHAEVSQLASFLRGDRPHATVAASRTLEQEREVEEPLRRLTRRERQVLECLITEASRDEIGRLMGISPHTVRTHLNRIFAKLGVSSRHEVVVLALQAGLRPHERPAIGHAS
jgi:DNA-binding CsgD family transcriptional regulator